MQMKLLPILLCIALPSCTANQYAHQNFDMAPSQTFMDKETGLAFSIRDKPDESRLKMLMGVGGTMALLVGGENAIPPIPMYEAAAVKFLASGGRECTVTRSFEIIPSEVEIQYACK